MKQKPWDRYEAALLLSYCLKIEAGDIPRKEAVDIVSNTLRKRAEVQGVEIDETFRNTNGISMQMSAIRNCYLGKDHGLAGSKLFHEMVDLYKSNHDALEQILQGESDKVNRSIWQEFLLWLKEAVPDKEKEIVTSLAAVSMLALKSNRTHMPISEISDVAEIERLQSIMRKPGALGLHSKKMLTKASHALNTYVQFLDKKADDAAAPEESQSVSVEESVAHANFRVDFSKSISYAHTKPISCKYKGRDISCAGWNALFINLTRLIYQECGDTFPVGCSLLSSSRIDIGNAEGMNYPKEIANGVYLECNASATGIVNKLHALFDICGINYDDVIIEYCKTSDNIVSEKEVKASNPQVAALEKLLSKHYKYGFRLGSPIELMRIRNFAEEDGIFLADSDEELERKIAATGIKIDGKVFIIESEILSGIAAVTDSVFDEGATVIFLNQLMEIKEEWLSEQHITNVDMLKTLLKRIRPNYYYGQNIITPGEKSTEHDAIVKEILRISTGQSVVRTDALKEKLPYIPTEKIAWSLSTSPEFIWISEGKYFLMNQFVLSEEDANTISEHVANECELNGYASITDLPLGNIQEENYELSETAIYAAVYSTVLKEHYYLHGKILTKEENGVDISALLKAYCAGKSCCTASELMERAEELTGTPNKQTSMAILYDSMIRVDMDEFVSEDQIHFDTNAVDTLLKSMVGTRFAPIRSVNTFALFPSCGASWNHYILESFCYRFSEGYRHDLLSSPLNSFIDLYAPYLTGFSHEECEIIKNSITEDMFVLSATKGNAVVKKAADDYRKGQVKDQLFRLWSERTGGTKSPKHWSEHYKTPILCCIDPEIYGEAKKAFAVLNSSQHSESEIKMALEFCEGADFFDVIADSDYRNKCFMEQIVGCYSKLLPDITAIRSALEDTDIAPYDWADDPRIKAKIKNMASVEYNAGGSDAAINTIESMPIDQLKTWLKQLAVSDMELGVKIISNGGKNA